MVILLTTVGLFSFKPQDKEKGVTIPYEKFVLPNGLTVVLNVDKSDPIAALAVYYHVGSSREVPGKTGFAHLFEHMMFQKSENIGKISSLKISRVLVVHLMAAQVRTGPTIMRLYQKMLSRWQCGWNPTGWVTSQTPLQKLLL